MMLIDLMKFCCRNLYLWLFLYIYITLCGLYVTKNCYVPKNCSNFVQQHATFYICKEIATTHIMSLVKYGCRRKREKRKSLPNSSKVFFGCRLLLYAILAVLVISISGDVESNPGPASITNSHQASSFLQSRSLKVALLNIRSIYNKIDSLKLLLNEKPFDIFTISETWLNSYITDGEISIPGYTFSRNDWNGRSGGGTLALVRDGIPYKIRTDLLSSNIESTVIEITRPKCKSLFIFTIYKAPDQLLESLTEELDAALSSISLEAEVILLGNFNVNFLATKNYASRTLKRKLLSFTSMYNLEQLIDKPTRITENSSTLIDLLFANNNHRIVSSGVLHVNLSDHSLIYCVIKAGVRRAPGRVIEYRSYKTYS